MRIDSYLDLGRRGAILLAVLALGETLPACSDSSADNGTLFPDMTSSDPDGGGNNSPDSGPLNVPAEPPVTETPIPANYWPLGVDQGIPPYPDDPIRALMIFPLRAPAALAARVVSMYNPASPQFHSYLSFSEYLSYYAPVQSNIDDVSAWLTSKGFKVERVSRTGLMLHYSGTIGLFNSVFGTTLHNMKRSPTTVRDWTLAPLTALDVPPALVGKIKRMILPDVEVDTTPLSKDTAPIDTTPPPQVATKIVPAQLASAYGLSALYGQGFKGAGMTLGIIGATTFRVSDVQSMWQTFGITRKNPTVIETMEPIPTRGLETALDIQLAGAMVPEAEILFYGGPNTSDTTLLYTFDAAVGDARAQVLSDSFAHAEATTPIATAHSYDESALIAAALGITIVSAAGDSNQVDVPSDSPYVTAVGGTNVDLNPDGSWLHEQSWELGGCGLSKIFPQPAWQLGAYGAAKGQRAVADVSIAVGPSWVKFLSNWTYADGTSGSTPVFAAILTLVNQSRKVVGKPSVGFINPIIYQHQATRAAFHDIIDRGSGGCATTVGYDLATGIGSPKAAELAAAMP